ncbi:hypothetical protein [Georgenia muralis]
MSTRTGCDPLDVACTTSSWTTDGGTGALEQLAGAVREALDTTLGSLGTMWTSIVTPSLTDGDAPVVAPGEVAPGSAETVNTVLSWVLWVSLGIAVMSIIALGATMAIKGRRGEAEGQLGRLGVVLGAVILVSSASAIVSALVPPERFAASGGGPAAATQNALWWFTAAMAVLSVMVAGTKMAWEQRAAPGRDLVRSLLTLVVVAGAGLTVIGLAVVAADSFAAWLLERVTGGADFGTQVEAMLTFSDDLGVLLVIVLGLAALVVAFAQIMLMVLRAAMLVILAGIFPLSASFTNTAIGRTWFHRVVAWIIAFVLYKPAVAIVYATAFQLRDQNVFADDGSGLVPVLTGIILMTLALLALPALISVAAPLVGTVTGTAGPATTTTSTSTSAALPTGAVPVPRVRAGGSGPAGAVGTAGRVTQLGPSGARAEIGAAPVPGVTAAGAASSGAPLLPVPAGARDAISPDVRVPAGGPDEGGESGEVEDGGASAAPGRQDGLDANGHGTDGHGTNGTGGPARLTSKGDGRRGSNR